MHSRPLAFATPAEATPWQRWLVFSPLARLVVFVVLYLAIGFAVNHAVVGLGWARPGATPLEYGLLQLSLRALTPLAAYLLLVRLIERREVRELSLRRLVPDGAQGLACGALLFSTVVGVLWLLGSYHVVGLNPTARWFVPLLAVGIGAGIGEEIICRGALYRIVEEGLGTWIALAISALFFGAAHINNPGATMWAAAAIAIEAGILLALLYLVTRSLWVCIGLHAAWNFMQGTVFGIPVSGTKADGWLVSTRSGPDWLSGGVFGAEASVVALVLCTLVSATLLTVALRRGLIVPPCWRRQPSGPQAVAVPVSTSGG